MIEGAATVLGPATKEEKGELDWLVERGAAIEDEIQHIQENPTEADDKRLLKQIDEDIGQLRPILEIIDTKRSD